MKIRNKKGFEIALKNVTLIVLLLITLTTIVGYFTGTFREAGSPVGDAAEEAREGARDFGIFDRLTGIRAGGFCQGTPQTTDCNYFYQTGLDPNGATCEIPSCRYINGYPMNGWGEITTMKRNDANSHWISCYIFDYRGKGICVGIINRYQWYRNCFSCSSGDDACNANPSFKGPIDDVSLPEVHNECVFSCSDLSVAGKAACECAGCQWES